MSFNKRISLFSIGLLLIFNVAGCASMGKPQDKIARVQITSTNTINPNSENMATPVVVIIYQLKDTTTFKSASFFDLYHNAKQTLNADLLGKSELVITPGITKKLDLPFNANTRYFGVIAAYQNLTDSNWYAIYKIKSSWGRVSFTIALTNSQISIK